MRKLILFLAIIVATAAVAQKYDLVIEGGRVMDPESGLDAVRNVGIANGKVARISTDPLAGIRVLGAKGLIVAPGFIDLHQHGQDNDSGRVKAFDGVTTALELEIGVAGCGQLSSAEERSLAYQLRHRSQSRRSARARLRRTVACRNDQHACRHSRDPAQERPSYQSSGYAPANRSHRSAPER